jgi:hypothetical protein
MKNRIVEELKTAQESGRVASEKIYEIVRKAVADAVSKSRTGAEEIRSIVKNALPAAVDGLKAVGADSAENIRAGLQGAVDGARIHMDKAVYLTRREMRELEAKLAAEKAELAQTARSALQGAKEAGETFSEEIRAQIESISTDIKLKSTEMFGLTRQTVKEAVKQAIASGDNVRKTVAQITKNATENALKEGRFRASRLKEIVEKVLSGAMEAAEESGKEIEEVAHGAFEGVQKGIASVLESIEDKTRGFLQEDLARTKEDLQTIEELFTETALKVAKRSGETAKEVLTDLVVQAEKTTSILGEKTRHVTEKVAERMKSVGRGTVKTGVETADKWSRVMAEEAMELGKRSVDVAKGAVSGMWKGTREAIQKGGHWRRSW